MPSRSRWGGARRAAGSSASRGRRVREESGAEGRKVWHRLVLRSRNPARTAGEARPTRVVLTSRNLTTSGKPGPRRAAELSYLAGIVGRAKAQSNKAVPTKTSSKQTAPARDGRQAAFRNSGRAGMPAGI